MIRDQVANLSEVADVILQSGCRAVLCATSLGAKVSTARALGRIALAAEQIDAVVAALSAPVPAAGAPGVGGGDCFDLNAALAELSSATSSAIAAADDVADAGTLDRLRIASSVLVLPNDMPCSPQLFGEWSGGRLDTTAAQKAARVADLNQFRPASWATSDAPDLFRGSNDALVSSTDEVGRLLHFLTFDIEISVLEICCALAIDAVDFPPAFRRDMASQAADEARHAEMLGRVMRQMGVEPGQFALSSVAWRDHQSCESVIDQLIAQHVLSEGSGIDGAGKLIPALTASGLVTAADVITAQNRDELAHCRTAIDWLLWAYEGDGHALAQRVVEVAARLGGDPPKDWPASEDRRAAGFDRIADPASRRSPAYPARQ